jgi:hypothetical protein
MLQMRLERIGSDIRDTFVGDIHLIEFDIHYQTRGGAVPFNP